MDVLSRLEIGVMFLPSLHLSFFVRDYLPLEDLREAVLVYAGPVPS